MKGSAYTPPLVSNSSDLRRLVRVRIREATRRDLLGILGIERLAFDHPWSLDSFVRELSLPFSRTTVAIVEREGNENLVGYLCRWVVADECHVLNVAVDPEIRRQGIGARLMYDAIAEARLKQAHLVTLEVRR